MENEGEEEECSQLEAVSVFPTGGGEFLPSSCSLATTWMTARVRWSCSANELALGEGGGNMSEGREITRDTQRTILRVHHHHAHTPIHVHDIHCIPLHTKDIYMYIYLYMKGKRQVGA